MPEPHLLVQQRQQQADLAPLLHRHPVLQQAGEMQRTQILLPQEVEPVVEPTHGDLDGEFVRAGAIERPVVGADHVLKQVQEYGRASCREREWQYVWLWVVAEE